MMPTTLPASTIIILILVLMGVFGHTLLLIAHNAIRAKYRDLSARVRRLEVLLLTSDDPDAGHPHAPHPH